MTNPTAAIVVIGNEILSGSTQDLNAQYIAKQLSSIGIILLEIRAIPDKCEIIVDTILSIKSKYTYVFTTGGIGPTHDDITTESIAKAFNAPLQINTKAYERISAIVEKSCDDSASEAFLGLPRSASDEHADPEKQRHQGLKEEYKSGLMKMAYLPKNATLISNNTSGAFGFIIENVFVMAGVPTNMQGAFQEILPLLSRGEEIHVKNLELMIHENLIVDELAAIQKKYPDVEIGSYPFHAHDTDSTSLILRSTNASSSEQAFEELARHFSKLVK